MDKPTQLPEVQHLAVQMGMDHKDIYLTAFLVANYNQSTAAELLGMSRTTFQNQLKKNSTEEQRIPKVGVKPPYHQVTAFALIDSTPARSRRRGPGTLLGLVLAAVALFCMVTGFGPAAVNSQPVPVSIEIPVKFEGQHEERICNFDPVDFSVMCK